jgi:hypothetical protein
LYSTIKKLMVEDNAITVTVVLQSCNIEIFTQQALEKAFSHEFLIPKKRD